jgi:hypothetical protein
LFRRFLEAYCTVSKRRMRAAEPDVARPAAGLRTCKNGFQ